MMSKLIKKNDSQKLEVLRYIYIHQSVTIKDIMHSFDLPRSTAKRTLDELFADLDIVITDSEFVIHGDDHTYSLSFDDENQLNQVYLKLKLFYCNNSISFNLLKLLLFNDIATVASASKLLNISIGHCYRSIIKINEVITEFGVTIENNYENFYLSGREETIRLICFEMLTKTYLGVKWPFSIMSIEDIQAQIEPERLRALALLSPAEKEKVLYIYMIRLKRFKFKNKFISLSKNQQDVLDVILEVNDVTTALSDRSKQLDLGMLSIDEIYFINFFSRLFFPKIDLDEKRSNISEELLKLDNPASLFILDFVTQFMEQLNLTTPVILYESIYFVSMAFLFNQYFKVDAAPLVDVPYANEQDAIEYNSPIYQMTSEFVITYIQENRNQYPDMLDDFNNQTFLIDLLYSIIVTYKRVTLNVYITFTFKSLTTERLLGNKLQQIFNQETFRIVHDIHQADLIISDSLINSATDADFLYFDSFGEPLLWEKLVNQIQEKIIGKLYSTLLE